MLDYRGNDGAKLSAAVPPLATAQAFAAIQEICQTCGHWQDGKCMSQPPCEGIVAWDWEDAPEREDAP